MIAQVCRYVHGIRGFWRNFSPIFRWTQTQDADTLVARSPAVSRAAKTCRPARYSLSSALLGFSCLPRSSVFVRNSRRVFVFNLTTSTSGGEFLAKRRWTLLSDVLLQSRLMPAQSHSDLWWSASIDNVIILLSKSLRPGSKMHAAVEKTQNCLRRMSYSY